MCKRWECPWRPIGDGPDRSRPYPDRGPAGPGRDREDIMSVTVEAVRAALATVKDPEIRRPITELDMVTGLSVDPAGVVEFTLLLTIAACPMRETLVND